MKRMILNLAIMCVCVTAMNKNAYAISANDIVAEFEREGAFVNVPAITGGIIFMIPAGIVAYAVCLPTAGLYDLITDGEAMGGCFVGPVMLAAGVGMIVVGLPFYIIKKVFWDFPKYMLEKLSLSSDATSLVFANKLPLVPIEVQ